MPARNRLAEVTRGTPKSCGVSLLPTRNFPFPGSPAYPAPTVADLERKAREKYSGPLALGTDLMAFDDLSEASGMTFT